MPYKITEECAACGTCEESCPTGAIQAKRGSYNIDDEVCIECGACEAACPNGAIVPT
jgi:ferredoxin